MGMRAILVINSKTGFTQKYAAIVSKKLTIPCISLKELTKQVIEQHDVLIFGTRIYAGRLDQFNQLKARLSAFPEKQLVVFTTGATPEAAYEVIARIWRDNLSDQELKTIPHFYLQSGLNYEKMNILDKTIMKTAAALMSRKKKKDSTEKGFEQAIKHSYDISSEKYALPLINYLDSVIQAK